MSRAALKRVEAFAAAHDWPMVCHTSMRTADLRAVLALAKRADELERQKHAALKVLRIADRNIGKDWPIVSLSVAVALESLGVSARKPLPRSRRA